MKADSRIDKWVKWQGIIQNDLVRLLELRYVFRETQKIIKANRKIQIDGYFYDWLWTTYSTTASVSVRRQVQPNSEVINLRRLLSEIQRSPEILSFNRFEEMYTQGKKKGTEEEKMTYNFMERQAKKEFQQFSGELKDHVDPSIVCNDIILLVQACEPIVKYVNKRVAHRDKKPFTSFPTFNDLDKAIDTLLDVFKKYMGLLQGVHFLPPGEPQWDWKEVFKVPWI
ncbi:MAG: hypothetical protein HY276_12990 [Ignavibacteriales bacterium]|nr:hypothetical protein [Ignavibacteriales bacterium]